MGKAPAFQSFKEFKRYCLENRRFGLSVLRKTGQYTPFLFGDLENLKPDTKIEIYAGYYVIKELTKVLKPRATSEYKNWRKACFSRDDFKCQNCSSRNNLEAHHKIPINRNPKLATVVSNGITLCKDCHNNRHRK